MKISDHTGGIDTGRGCSRFSLGFGKSQSPTCKCSSKRLTLIHLHEMRGLISRSHLTIPNSNFGAFTAIYSDYDHHEIALPQKSPPLAFFFFLNCLSVFPLYLSLFNLDDLPISFSFLLEMP